jgi:hypothetical protein
MKQAKLYLHYDGPGPAHTFIWRSSNSDEQSASWRGVLQAFCRAYTERHPGTNLSALKLALRTAAGEVLTPSEKPFADTGSELRSGADITVIESDAGEAAAASVKAAAAAKAKAVQAKPALTTLEASNPRDPAIQQVNPTNYA